MNQARMLLVTTPTIEEKQDDRVQGNTVRAGNIGREFLAGLRNGVGGEVRQYSRLLTECREPAMGRMVQPAEGLGAGQSHLPASELPACTQGAIALGSGAVPALDLRFAASMKIRATAEILVYATALAVAD